MRLGSPASSPLQICAMLPTTRLDSTRRVSSTQSASSHAPRPTNERTSARALFLSPSLPLPLPPSLFLDRTRGIACLRPCVPISSSHFEFIRARGKMCASNSHSRRRPVAHLEPGPSGGKSKQAGRQAGRKAGLRAIHPSIHLFIHSRSLARACVRRSAQCYDADPRCCCCCCCCCWRSASPLGVCDSERGRERERERERGRGRERERERLCGCPSSRRMRRRRRRMQTQT
ncbi:hypothetical protein MARPO_0058s0089 [Marchantia polymorpha]|uniref:Uncharacterized protein n=1 Tax=Marchantia polymorpha TaxID=3197 RepID=A0A2R6WU38_MARPO|nr:hypothetical protein MARPO_0058s0089 [Marchantia polymorpha]|eukprot:PTQ37314.1 hypothetical protein MARPO_0058s0089 [Marchantia polymorpha]